MNLNQVTIPSLNVPKAIDFYKKLGLRLIVHTHDAYARFECPEGNSTFSIHQVTALPQGNGIVLYFETSKLDAEVKRLQQHGITFDQKPVDQPWLWREAKLRDPDGNQIILYFAGDNRKNPPWRTDAGN